MNELVSVIVPTKNSDKTLDECLLSIKNQTYNNIELIIVDNYSDDNTANIAKKYTKLVFNKGPERSWQRNYAAKKASGKYILVIDSDMILSKNVVSECVNKINKSTSNSGVVIPEESFGEGFWAQCKKLERSFYVGVSYMEAARFFRLNEYLSVGGYNTSMISGEDWDLSQRMASIGKIKRINSYIYHNEGKISLYKTVKKKFYYAIKFQDYVSKNKNSKTTNNQVNLFKRYKLFFSKPNKLFKDPFLGAGMLFMKTCEFIVGSAGHIAARVSYKND